ncbi:hypothetical protein [Terrarubrum flagellatum]|uniref:hypothetical protein n=1 Tax=Terrirubrum flagellatum TaxID=2895980 RepID=UPI0031453C49
MHDFDGEGDAALSAMGELARGHALLKSCQAVKIGRELTAITPTLWEDVYAGEADSFFAPFMLTTLTKFLSGDDPLRRMTAALGSFAATGVARVKKGQKTARGVFGYRINAPFPVESIDKAFLQEGREPEFGEIPAYIRREKRMSIVAVIDDGFAFAHANLRDRNGSTRVECCWLQSGSIAPRKQERTVLFGRELTRVAIDRLASEYSCDEDELYRVVGGAKAKYGGAASRFGAHGSHVLDIAAGYRHEQSVNGPASRKDEAGDDLDLVRIIAVQLPAPITAETTGFGKDAALLSAFHYIFDRADRIAKQYGIENPPLAINFSYGYTGGPHNGSEPLERAIKQLIDMRSKRAVTSLVMPSGNNFQSSLYGEITSQNLRNNRFTIPWRIPPNDRTSNYLEIWLPEGAGKKPERPRIIGPTGPFVLAEQIMGSARQGLPLQIWDILSDDVAIGQLSVDEYRPGLWRMLVIAAPTEVVAVGVPAAPCGLWRIEVEPNGALSRGKRISCRIQRDADPLGYARGARQSYFDDPSDRPFDGAGAPSDEDAPGAFVRRFGSINGIATHECVITVGGYSRATQLPAPYSSSGAVDGEDESRPSVSYSAPSSDSTALPGISAAGTRSGSRLRLVGTSAAAPQFTRALAIAALSPAREEGGRSRPHHAKSLVERLPHLRPVVADPASPHNGQEFARRRARLGAAMLVDDDR